MLEDPAAAELDITQFSRPWSSCRLARVSGGASRPTP